MQRTIVLLLVAVSGLLLSACGELLTIAEGCRITDVRVDARRDDRGNQVDVHEFRFIGDSGCHDTRVNASYNLATRVAEEKLRQGDGFATASWHCTSDPWTNAGALCTRDSMAFSGSSEFSQEDITNFETAKFPLSSYPLVPIDRDTLRGQLGNALKRLPPLRSDILNEPIDVVDCVCDGSVVAAPPAAPITGELVKKNATGPRVEAIQLLLRQAGADVVVDGEFGEQTRAAVENFQQSRGLGTDGIVGPQTWGALWITLREGAAEEDAVRAAQTLLRWHNQPVLIDGDFGGQTISAVRAFQQIRGLGQDGVIGRQTWTALVNAP